MATLRKLSSQFHRWVNCWGLYVTFTCLLGEKNILYIYWKSSFRNIDATIAILDLQLKIFTHLDACSMPYLLFIEVQIFFPSYTFHLSELKQLINIFIRANMAMLVALQKREIQNSRNIFFNLSLKKTI